MTVNIQPSGILFSIDCILDMLIRDKAKTSRLIALLIVYKIAFLTFKIRFESSLVRQHQLFIHILSIS